MNYPKKLKIAIIDDDDFYGSLIRERLGLEDHIEVYLFEEASGFLHHLPPQLDIAIIDFGLPDVNGLEVLNFLKKNCPGVYTIMLSSNKDLRPLFTIYGYLPNMYIIKNEYAIKSLMECLDRFRYNRLPRHIA